jgi:hypothetical protein
MKRAETTTAAEAVTPDADAAPAGRAEPRRRGPRWGRWLSVIAWALVVLALVGLALLSQTQRGQRMVIERVLAIARGELAGELYVDEIRSRMLLTGVTLAGVRLDAAGARPFLTADSAVVRYTPLSLLLGTPRLHSTTLHGMRLEISRYPGDDFLNVSRLLAQGPPRPDSAAAPSAPRTIALGRISVRDGLVEVLTPADEMSERTMSAPGGGALQRIAFDIGDLDLEETILRPGGAVELDARLGSLSASISVLERPIVIREAIGRISFGALGLRVADAAIRLPETLTRGSVRFGPDRPGDPWVLAADLTSEGWGDLADLQWIDPRIPDGRFRGGMSARVQEGIDLQLRAFEAQLGASHLVASGRARFDDGIVMQNLRITANPVATSRLEPWLGRELPIGGFLSGQVVFGGTSRDLHATGRLTLVPAGMGGGSTTADFSGTFHMGDDPGATALEVRLDPLNYRLLEAFWPEARGLGGGSARLEVNGRAADGIQVAAAISLAPDAASASRLVGSGELTRGVDRRWAAVASGELMPLSLSLLGRIWPELDLRGTVRGPVRAAGPLSDLQVGGELSVGGGSVLFDGAMDFEALGAAYRLQADLSSITLSDFTERLPDPTVVTGSVALVGSGFGLDSLSGEALLVARASRIGPARIDSAMATLSAGGGVLTADTLQAHVSGARVVGAGSLGIVPDAYGEARLAFDIPSLLELRPIFMGDSLLVRDELNPLEQDLLRIRGIEPDTLPTALDVRMAGSIQGTAVVRGHVEAFELDLALSLADVAYGHDEVERADVSLAAGGLPATFGDWMVEASTAGVVWAGRQFEAVDFGGTMSERQGEGALTIQRRRNERYFLTGGFGLDSIGGYTDLTEASIQLNGVSWILSRPTRIAWTESSLVVDSLEIEGFGEDPMRIVAGGTLTRGGDSNFRLHTEAFHIARALQIAQREDVDVGGTVDLTLSVLGPSEQPVIDAVFTVHEPRVGEVQLSRVDGSLQYADRSSRFGLEGWSESRNVLHASGVFPYDLALTDVSERVTDETMDVTVSADSLAAATALGYVSGLQNVQGMLSADFHIGGTSRSPRPSGTVRLTDGAWTLEALGVRHTGVGGEILLRPDRTLEVNLETSRSGSSRVTGIVTLDELSNPALDLVAGFNRFLAVDRIDMESTISGEFRLTGRYQLPVVEGRLRVDQGTLFVEEFERASTIVDLTDPMLYADGFAVDTTVFVSQPVLAGLRNPFLDNLRMNISLSVPQDMWLRSDVMNVEMGGDLLVVYDRREGDLVLLGQLQALRGSYVVLGRTFQVQGGTVEFVGQPGINPTLDIRARSRIRRREQDPLQVEATVGGTLIQPVVTLSSEEAGLSQSDLVGYLVFGRPASELATRGGAGSGLTTFASGALANQLGGTLARGVGLDYVAFSQGAGLGGAEAREDPVNLLRNALVEAGRYLTDDLFLVFVIGSRAGATGAQEDAGGVGLLGVRLELALTDNFFVEGFAENRFLRSGSGGLGVSGLEEGMIYGAFLFRDWGYGSQR